MKFNIMVGSVCAERIQHKRDISCWRNDTFIRLKIRFTFHPALPGLMKYPLCRTKSKLTLLNLIKLLFHGHCKSDNWMQRLYAKFISMLKPRSHRCTGQASPGSRDSCISSHCTSFFLKTSQWKSDWMGFHRQWRMKKGNLLFMGRLSFNSKTLTTIQQGGPDSMHAMEFIAISLHSSRVESEKVTFTPSAHAPIFLRSRVTHSMSSIMPRSTSCLAPLVNIICGNFSIFERLSLFHFA